MSLEQTRKVCKRCNSHELHARPATNHILHLLISVLLCGLWIPIWILSVFKIGGWRCQKCGAKQGEPGFVLCLISILTVLGLAIWNLFFNAAVSKKASPGASLEMENKARNLATIAEGNSGVVVQPPPTPAPTIPEIIKPEPDVPFVSPYLKSLEGIRLPVTLVVDEAFNLLDATGKEVLIDEGKKIWVTKRTDSGTLTITIDGKLCVGNESRLSGKVRIDDDDPE